MEIQDKKEDRPSSPLPCPGESSYRRDSFRVLAGCAEPAWERSRSGSPKSFARREKSMKNTELRVSAAALAAQLMQRIDENVENR
jgi:hypothetical protein